MSAPPGRLRAVAVDDGDIWHVEVEADGDSAAHVPEGRYQARVVHGKIVTLFRTRRLVLTFELLQSTHAGTRLEFFAELKTTKHARFRESWEIANGAPAKRRDRMSLNVFRNRLFLVSVRSVTTTRFQRRRAHPYSVIDSIIERQA